MLMNKVVESNNYKYKIIKKKKFNDRMEIMKNENKLMG